MINPCCKDCPARHPACHDHCPRFAAWRAEHAAEVRYTNTQRACARIGKNAFDQEFWMKGKRK